MGGVIRTAVRARAELRFLGRVPKKRQINGFNRHNRLVYLAHAKADGTLGLDFYYDLVDHRAGGEVMKRRLIMNRAKAAWLNRMLRGTGMSLGKAFVP
jgi:hypothetical protein